MKNLLTNNFRANKGSKNLVVLGLLVAALVLIVLIAVIAFTLINMKEKTAGAASQLVGYFPESAVMYAEISLTPEKFQELQNISGGQLTLDKIAENIQKVSQNPKESIEALQVLHELNNTLEPVIAMGMWDIDQTTQTPEKAVIAVIVKNPSSVDSMMQRITEEKTTFEKKNVDGIDFHVTSEGNGCYTVIGNVLLISDKIETLEESIQLNKTKGKNIYSNKQVEEILENLQKDRIVTLVVNAGEIARKISPAAANHVQADSQAMEEVSKVVPYTGVGVDLHNELLEAKFYAPYNLENVSKKAVQAPLEKLFNASSGLNAPKVLPKDTFMFVSFTGMSYLVETFVQMLDPQAQKEINNNKKMIKMMFNNLDVDSDILPLFSEELTVAGTITSNNEVEPVMLITSKPESEQVLNKVASTMVQMSMDPSASLSQVQAGNIELNLIKLPQMPFPIAYGKVDNVIILGKELTLKQITSEDKTGTLAETSNYEEMKKYMIPNVSFAMFMNLDKMLAASKIVNESPQQIKDLEKMSKNVSSIFISAGNKDDKAIEGNFIMKLKPQK